MEKLFILLVLSGFALSSRAEMSFSDKAKIGTNVAKQAINQVAEKKGEEKCEHSDNGCFVNKAKTQAVEIKDQVKNKIPKKK